MISNRTHPRFAGLRNASLAAAFSLSLAACFFEDAKPAYPALKQEDIVGCWRNLVPADATCKEECFDRDSLYYRKSNDGKASPLIIEFSGSYHIRDRNRVGASINMCSTTNRTIQQETLSQQMFRIRDTLFFLNDRAEMVVQKFIRSDSTNPPCGERWVYFEQPPGWAGK